MENYVYESTGRDRQECVIYAWGCFRSATRQVTLWVLLICLWEESGDRIGKPKLPVPFPEGQNKLIRIYRYSLRRTVLYQRAGDIRCGESGKNRSAGLIYFIWGSETVSFLKNGRNLVQDWFPQPGPGGEPFSSNGETSTGGRGDCRFSGSSPDVSDLK